MLKVNVGVSRKVSRDFNSTGFTLNLEGEVLAPIDDTEAVIERIREFYDVADEALNDQIARNAEVDAIARREADRREPQPSPPRPSDGQRMGDSPSRNGTSEGFPRVDPPNETRQEQATNKQVQYLLTLGRRLNLTAAQLEAEIEQIVGKRSTVYELSKRDAGRVIDSLSGNGNGAARTANHA